MRVYRSGGRHTFALRARAAYRLARVDGPVDVVVEDINKIPLFTPRWVEAPVVALVPHLFGTTAFREVAWPLAVAVWTLERAIPRVYRRVPFQVISESTAADLVARGIDRERIEVIHPGIDRERLHPKPGRSRFPEPTVVYVGRLKRYKGLEVVIGALRRLESAGVEARFLVAGQGDDRGRLERIARDEGVAHRVDFLGYVPEERKIEILQKSWAAVYPSPKEGWGISVIEAAAAGTPTVASDSPGLRDSVRDKASGFLVAHGDEEGWADRLRRLLTDEPLRERLGAEAMRHAAAYSWDEAAEMTERSLIRAVEARGATACT